MGGESDNGVIVKQGKVKTLSLTIRHLLDLRKNHYGLEPSAFQFLVKIGIFITIDSSTDSLSRLFAPDSAQRID